MAKQEPITIDNCKVLEALGGIRFRVELPNKAECICTIAGRMFDKNHIRVNPDDTVIIEVSPYDLTRGRIIYRTK